MLHWICRWLWKRRPSSCSHEHRVFSHSLVSSSISIITVSSSFQCTGLSPAPWNVFLGISPFWHNYKSDCFLHFSFWWLVISVWEHHSRWLCALIFLSCNFTAVIHLRFVFRVLYDLYFYNTIIIAISENFTGSAPIYMSFLSYLLLSMLYKTMLNKWWVGSPLSFSWSHRNRFYLFILELMSVVSCHIRSLYFPFSSTLVRVFIINGRWIMSYAFFASVEMIIQFLSCIFLVCCSTWIDLRMLNNPCIPGINPAWRWYNIVFMYLNLFC